MSFLSVLTLVFVAAKLFGVISWSWWVVFIPLLINIALYVVVFILGVIITFME